MEIDLGSGSVGDKAEVSTSSEMYNVQCVVSRVEVITQHTLYLNCIYY